MNRTPPYFKQESQSTCSFAVLKMVLGHYGIGVTEKELLDKVTADYGEDFKNIWNPTIAKLARQYGIKTDMYALWPLFKRDIMAEALKEYESNPNKMNVNKYENPKDKDRLPEPLPLAYKEMFEAVKLGCWVHYGGITPARIKSLLNKGFLIQTSIKLEQMYPGAKTAFHSLLLYAANDNTVHYHDPYQGKQLQSSIDHLVKAAMNVGAFMVYKGI